MPRVDNNHNTTQNIPPHYAGKTRVIPRIIALLRFYSAPSQYLAAALLE